jgi:hypothetical protein
MKIIKLRYLSQNSLMNYQIGYWSLKDRIACYRNAFLNEEICYDKETLLMSIENVKNSRNSYGMEEAYQSSLRHFATGLLLFDCQNKP